MAAGVFDRKWLAPLGVWLIVSAIFLTVNSGAYRSYFDGTDLIRLDQFNHHAVWEFLVAMLSPMPRPELDGPAGRLTFGLLGKLWRGSPVPYLVALQGLHLANLALLMLLVAKLGSGLRAISLAAAVFAVHAGVIEAYWGPGHIVEVQCAFFVLLSLLAWFHDWPVASVIAFWFAIESDLSAVFLPLALAVHVWYSKPDQLKRLAIHGGVMLYGLLQMTLAGQWHTSLGLIWRNFSYYGSELLVVPHALEDSFTKAMILLMAAALAAYTWKLHRFSYSMMAALMLPLLLRAGMLGEWSLYLPVLGVALFAAACADILGSNVVLWAAIFFLVEAPFYWEGMKDYRTKIAQVRAYVETAVSYQSWPEDGRAVLLDDAPELLGMDGAKAALRLEGLTIPIEPVTSQRGHALLSEPSFMLLDWSSHRSLLMVHQSAARPAEPMLYFNTGFAALDLGPGWFKRADGARWTEPEATVRLRRPEWADEFAITVDIPSAQILKLGEIRLRISSRGKALWKTTFRTSRGWTDTWDLPTDIPVGEDREYRLGVDPVWTLPGTTVQVGINVKSMGFRKAPPAK